MAGVRPIRLSLVDEQHTVIAFKLIGIDPSFVVECFYWSFIYHHGWKNCWSEGSINANYKPISWRSTCLLQLAMFPSNPLMIKVRYKTLDVGYRLDTLFWIQCILHANLREMRRIPLPIRSDLLPIAPALIVWSNLTCKSILSNWQI